MGCTTYWMRGKGVKPSLISIRTGGSKSTLCQTIGQCYKKGEKNWGCRTAIQKVLLNILEKV